MKEYCFLAPARVVETFAKVKDFVPDNIRDVNNFIQIYGTKTSAFFELGNFEGALWFVNISIGWKATAHLVIWAERLRHRSEDARTILLDLMDLYSLIKVEAYIPTTNIAATRFAEKVGFVKECVLSKWSNYGGKSTDIAVYNFLKEN